MNHEKNNQDNPWRAMALVGTIGVELAVLVYIGYWLGNKLDDVFYTSPFFLLIGILLGLAIGVFSIVKLINIFLKD